MTPQGAVKTCLKCGAQNHVHARFCAHCGAIQSAKRHDLPATQWIAVGVLLLSLPVGWFVMSRDGLTDKLARVERGMTIEDVADVMGKATRCGDAGGFSGYVTCDWSENGKWAQVVFRDGTVTEKRMLNR